MYTAVIIEPRCHKALGFVLGNFLENLNNDWNIIIFHGNLNINFVHSIINNKLSQYASRVSFVNLGIDNLTQQEYSSLLINDKSFYDHIPTETFLIFQTDTMIFKKYKSFINCFLKYDYVGAPWLEIHRMKNNESVGNGGLSLRKKSKMLEIMEKENDRHLPEDVYFSATSTVSLFKPSFKKARRFSVEHVPARMTFGCHQPWYQREVLTKFFPEVKMLISLNDK